MKLALARGTEQVVTKLSKCGGMCASDSGRPSVVAYIWWTSLLGNRHLCVQCVGVSCVTLRTLYEV